MTGLTHQQHACLKAIQDLTEEGVPPTMDQISEALSTSKSSVHRMIGILEQRGMVRKLPRQARSIEVLPTSIGPSQLMRLTSAELRTTAAHIAGILAHREGGEHAHQFFQTIAARVIGRSITGEN